MPGAQSRAEAVWRGDLPHGTGEVTSTSGVFGPLPLTWAARTVRVSGLTSPEELLAAAQAGCYAMALSNALAKRGTPPTSLRVTATATFDVGPNGARVSTMEIEVHGQVPSLDEPAFMDIAAEAEKSCPIANALRGNVDIHVSAHLEGN